MAQVGSGEFVYEQVQDFAKLLPGRSFGTRRASASVCMEIYTGSTSKYCVDKYILIQ
jgi:hypothetical protein